MYYINKINILKDIFATNDIYLEEDKLLVSGHPFPIIDDVIIFLNPSKYTDYIKKRLGENNTSQSIDAPVPGSRSENPSGFVEKEFAGDIQFTFGEEWKKYHEVLSEHQNDFKLYFDIFFAKFNLAEVKNMRVCDLGCGIGRWSYFLQDKCKDIILIDFSDAIFEARHNLKDASNSLFFMGDLKELPFRENFADFIFSLGVLHHLSTNALDEIVKLRRYAPILLIYIYYALDNRPFYFRILLSMVTLIRKITSKIRNALFRKMFSEIVTFLVYIPLVYFGQLLKLLGFSIIAKKIPLYETYSGMSAGRIEQDVYDRFFTSIEQRFTKRQILELKSSFSQVIISEEIPYWHFLCIM